MKIELKTVEKKSHQFKHYDDGLARCAEVTEIDGKFEKCKYDVGGNKNHYDVDDWAFLRVVADFIQNKFKSEVNKDGQKIIN